MEITSKEMVKPSSPTPHHLQTLKFSFLDQLSAPIYGSYIFFYQADQLLLQPLKRSLSNVLTQFYPLAVRVSSEKLSIDCNDSGVLFVETKIHAKLLEVIRDPAMGDLEKFLPLGSLGSNCSMSEANTVALAVQINRFDGGGIAVAAQLHHKAADGISLLNFLNAWAVAFRGCEILSPTFCNLANVFPPIHMSSSGFKSAYGMVTEKIVTRRIVFDKKQLEKIKLAEREVSQVKDATRVEAITAHFMRRFKDVARAKGSKKQLAVIHAVNLRHKMDPPLPYHAFGNASMDAPPKLVDDVGDMVRVLRTAINKCDGDYVQKLQRHGGGYLNFLNNIESSYITCGFSSLCRLRFYEVDYGWGRPIWVYPGILPYKNFVLLMPTSSGDGMEAFVHILEEDAASIDSHLVYAKL